MNFLRTLALCTAGLLATFGAQAADVFPDKPIQIVIPYPPGGSADAVGRPLSVALAKHLKSPVILDYKGGASGTIATGYVARAKPDGYTLILVLAAHAINPSLYPKLPYDTVKDFTSLGKVAELPLGIYLNPAFPARNVEELIAYAKKNPGQVTFSSAGNGNTTHLATELFANMAGVKILHVPYKGGGPALTAALGGEVSGMFDGTQTYNMAKAGKLRAIGFASDKRIAFAPDVPTVSEAGLKDFVVSGWYGVLAPAGLPADVEAVLSKGLRAALDDPEFRKTVEPLGYVVTPASGPEFQKYVQQEQARWADVIQKAGVKLE